MEYQDFLKNKIRLAQNTGFDVLDSDINPNLKPHNKLMVKWMVKDEREMQGKNLEVGAIRTIAAAIRFLENLK